MPRVDPYRFLFPIGFVLGVFGAALWILFYSGALATYPVALHASTMMSGFQFCAATGFLMTGIPRFTGTRPANATELGMGSGLGLLLLLISVLGTRSPGIVYLFFWVAFCFSLFLAYYFARRFVRRSRNPPPSFSFVAVALLFSIFGNLILALAEYFPPSVVQLGRLFLYHGMMLGLVLGVASWLVMANLGWSPKKNAEISFQGKRRMPFDSSLIVTVLFVLSFFIEAFYSAMLGRVLRASVASFVIVPAWKPYRQPKSNTKMARWLWIASWCVFAGLWIYALVPTWATSGAHLMFIGGFSLMIFMIASRMILSNGGHDLAYEERSRVYALIVLATVSAATLRLLVRFEPAWSVRLTVAAASLLLLAQGIWAYAFLGKVLRHK